MKKVSKKYIFILIFFFLSSQFTFLFPSQTYAQSIEQLPIPGTLLRISPQFQPANVFGITLYPNDPLRFDFILDKGEENLPNDALKQDGLRMIKYFMASLTVPEDELWVNLSPYEKDRIIPEALSYTEMGQDMLIQDYLLKQLTSSLIYPEEEFGQEFWDRVYKRALEEYGTTNIPVNTFNKVWIVPREAIVYENWPSAFVASSHLSVMLEEDYLTLKSNINNRDLGTDRLQQKDVKRLNDLTSNIVREILIPEIEKEVNQGKSFARLRQIYNAMVLAMWYKRKLKQSLLGQIYADQSKIKGIDLEDKNIKEKLFNKYLEAFQTGVFNYIREDYDEVSQKVIPRKYFSGGLIKPEKITIINDMAELPVNNTLSSAIASGNIAKITVRGYELGPEADVVRARSSPIIDDRFVQQGIATLVSQAEQRGFSNERRIFYQTNFLNGWIFPYNDTAADSLLASFIRETDEKYKQGERVSLVGRVSDQTVDQSLGRFVDELRNTQAARNGKVLFNWDDEQNTFKTHVTFLNDRSVLELGPDRDALIAQRAQNSPPVRLNFAVPFISPIDGQVNIYGFDDSNRILEFRDFKGVPLVHFKVATVKEPLSTEALEGQESEMDEWVRVVREFQEIQFGSATIGEVFLLEHDNNELRDANIISRFNLEGKVQVAQDLSSEAADLSSSAVTGNFQDKDIVKVKLVELLNWLAEREEPGDNFNFVFVMGSKYYPPIQRAAEIWQQNKVKIIVAGGIGRETATLRQLKERFGLSAEAEGEINRILDRLMEIRQNQGEEEMWKEINRKFHIFSGRDREKIRLRAARQLEEAQLDWIRFLGPYLSEQEKQSIESGQITTEEVVINRLLDEESRYDILIPEGIVYYANLLADGVAESDILVDAQSTTGPENIIYGAQVMQEAGFSPRNGILIQDSYMQRRAKATFLKQFPRYFSDWAEDNEIASYAPYLYTRESLEEMTSDVFNLNLSLALAEIEKLPLYYENGSIERVDVPTQVMAVYDTLQSIIAEEVDTMDGDNVSSAVGGINLDPRFLDLQIKRDGMGIPLPVTRQPIYNIQIEGILPVIINIAPVDLPFLLGAGHSV